MIVVIVLYALMFMVYCDLPSDDAKVVFSIAEDTDPQELASIQCENQYSSCIHIASNAISLFKESRYNSKLNWKHNPSCKCRMPNIELKQPLLQYLHIPKTGTSINWFLHDYFDNCTSGKSDQPCVNHLSKPSDQTIGLCGGRLFSCAGHRVSEDLPRLTLSTQTNLLTMLRDPWKRLQSDYYYITSKPTSGHLGPEINVTSMLSNINSIYEFTAYPGISNCATKMLNGIQCSADVPLTDTHLSTAKEVLMAMLWFGITDYFKTSVCLLAWMYGGDPNDSHFRKSRVGRYQRGLMHHHMNESEVSWFIDRERFDIALYKYAVEIFTHRLSLTGCSIIDEEVPD